MTTEGQQQLEGFKYSHVNNPPWNERLIVRPWGHRNTPDGYFRVREADTDDGVYWNVRNPTGSNVLKQLRMHPLDLWMNMPTIPKNPVPSETNQKEV